MNKQKKKVKIRSLIIGCEGEHDEVFLKHLYNQFTRIGKPPKPILCEGGGLKYMQKTFCKRIIKQYLPTITDKTSIYLFLDGDQRSDADSNPKKIVGNYKYETIFIEPICLEGFILEILGKLKESSAKDRDYKNEVEKCMENRDFIKKKNTSSHRKKAHKDTPYNREKVYKKVLDKNTLLKKSHDIPLLNRLINIFSEH